MQALMARPAGGCWAQLEGSCSLHSFSCLLQQSLRASAAWVGGATPSTFAPAAAEPRTPWHADRQRRSYGRHAGPAGVGEKAHPSISYEDDAQGLHPWMRLKARIHSKPASNAGGVYVHVDLNSQGSANRAGGGSFGTQGQAANSSRTNNSSGNATASRGSAYHNSAGTGTGTSRTAKASSASTAAGDSGVDAEWQRLQSTFQHGIHFEPLGSGSRKGKIRQRAGYDSPNSQAYHSAGSPGAAGHASRSSTHAGANSSGSNRLHARSAQEPNRRRQRTKSRSQRRRRHAARMGRWQAESRFWEEMGMSEEEWLEEEEEDEFDEQYSYGFWDMGPAGPSNRYQSGAASSGSSSSSGPGNAGSRFQGAWWERYRAAAAAAGQRQQRNSRQWYWDGQHAGGSTWGSTGSTSGGGGGWGAGFYGGTNTGGSTTGTASRALHPPDIAAHLAVLGLSRDAVLEEGSLKAAFRAAALRYHPDRWVGAASQGSSAQQQGSSAGGTDAATKREQAAELFKQSSVAFNALREYLGKQQQQQRAMGGARQS